VIEAADRANDHEPTIHWQVSRTSAVRREGSRKHLSPSAMRRLLSASMPTLASLASRVEANERRQIEDQAKNERRFEEIHAKMSAEVIPGLLDSIRKATPERRDYSTGKKAVGKKNGKCG